jgi:hypothetical protein
MTNDFDLKGKAREMSARQDSNFVFRVNNSESKEIIKLCDNGDIFVKGKLIEQDKELVQGMKDFLAVSSAETDKLRADLEVAKKALSDHETVYDMLLCEQKKTEQLEEDNAALRAENERLKEIELIVSAFKEHEPYYYQAENIKLSRQVSIYEKALEKITVPYKDIGLGCYHEEIAQAALEEGRK